MIETYKRKQRITNAHPWITNKQATQLLSYKYYYFSKRFERQQVQKLMDNFVDICCYSSEQGLRDLLARAQEWW